MEAIPDVPERITTQLERAAFITRKLIDRVSDDNDQDEAGNEGPLEIQKYPNFGGVYTHEVSENEKVYMWRSL